MGYNGKHLSCSTSSVFPKLTEPVPMICFLSKLTVAYFFFDKHISTSGISNDKTVSLFEYICFTEIFRKGSAGCYVWEASTNIQMRSAWLIRWSYSLRTSLLVSSCLFSPLLKEVQSDGAGTFGGNRDINDIINFVPSFLIKSRYLLQTVALGSEEIRWMLSDS